MARRRCPNARWVMDPFHVVQGITDTLDEVRCKEWQVAKKAVHDAIKGSRFALVKNP